MGDIGGLFSHEYHFPSPSGQDTLLCCLGDCGMVVSADLLPLKDERQCPKCGGGIKEQQGIEVSSQCGNRNIVANIKILGIMLISRMIKGCEEKLFINQIF